MTDITENGNPIYTITSLGNIEGELWVDINDYQGLYEISNMGRIKVVERHVTRTNGFPLTIKEQILKQDLHKDGGLHVDLRRDGVRYKHKTHRLVAIHFIPNPENKPQVNHKNGQRHDNRVVNLEWCTGSENMKHAFHVLKRENSMCGRVGSLHKASKPVIQMDMQGNHIAEHESARQAALSLGKSQSLIAMAANGRIKTAAGYKWKFA